MTDAHAGPPPRHTIRSQPLRRRQARPRPSPAWRQIWSIERPETAKRSVAGAAVGHEKAVGRGAGPGPSFVAHPDRIALLHGTGCWKVWRLSVARMPVRHNLFQRAHNPPRQLHILRLIPAATEVDFALWHIRNTAAGPSPMPKIAALGNPACWVAIATKLVMPLLNVSTPTLVRFPGLHTWINLDEMSAILFCECWGYSVGRD